MHGLQSHLYFVINLKVCSFLLFRLSDLNISSNLVVVDNLFHFRMDDIKICLGNATLCPRVTPETSSVEWNKMTRSNGVSFSPFVSSRFVDRRQFFFFI